MSPASLRWIALSALGLSAGVGIAVVLEDPIGALVGMVLVTPVLTLLAGRKLHGTTADAGHGVDSWKV